jgi:hypothetical protein
LEDAHAQVAAAKETFAHAETAVNKLRAEREAAQAAALQARAAEDAARLGDLLKQVDGHIAQARAEARAAEAIPATPERLQRAEQAAQDLAELRARLAAGAVTLRMTYSGAARLHLDGAPLPDGEDVPVAETVTLDLPGLGQMRIGVPGSDLSDLAAGVARAEARLQDALQACGADTLAAARDAATRRATHQANADMAQRFTQTLAPEGRAALEAQHAEAARRVASAPSEPARPLGTVLPELEQAEAALDAARLQLETRREAQTIARTEGSAAGAALAAARSRADAAAQAATARRAGPHGGGCVPRA